MLVKQNGHPGCDDITLNLRSELVGEKYKFSQNKLFKNQKHGYGPGLFFHMGMS